MSNQLNALTTEEIENVELTEGSKEIVRLASINKLTNWHGATGWMVTAAVAGGVCEIHVSFAGKKMKWFGPILGLKVGADLTGMTGVIYCEPNELMKHRYITINGGGLGVGGSKIEFWLSEGGVGFAGNLISAGIVIGGGGAVGRGEWAYE